MHNEVLVMSFTIDFVYRVEVCRRTGTLNAQDATKQKEQQRKGETPTGELKAKIRRQTWTNNGYGEE